MPTFSLRNILVSIGIVAAIGAAGYIGSKYIVGPYIFADDYIGPTQLTFGSTFNNNPRYIVAYKPGNYEIRGSAPWLIMEGTTLNVVPDPADPLRPGPNQRVTVALRVPNTALIPATGDQVALNIERRDDAGNLLGTSVVLVRANCSTSSRCGAPPAPPAPPPTTPPSSGGDDGRGDITPPPTPSTPRPPQPPPAPKVRTRESIVPGFKTDPIRPTYREVGLKMQAFNESRPYEWYLNTTINKAVTATQVIRDAVESTRSMYVPEVIRYARTLPTCTDEVQKQISVSQGFSGITSLLNPQYVIERSLKLHSINAPQRRNGIWSAATNGQHYSKQAYLYKDIQACSTDERTSDNGSIPAELCASNPLMTQNLLDLLDMRKEGGKCVKGALYELPAPLPGEKTDNALEQLGRIEVKGSTLMPVLTETQKGLLAETHHAHNQVMKWRCGEGPQPSATLVQDAHKALEASARNEEEHHFFRMMDFSGTPDPLWTGEEICEWAKLQDAAHQKWMDAVLAGDWAVARLFDTDHQNTHLCMNLKHTAFEVRLSCQPTKNSQCPVKSCIRIMSEIIAQKNDIAE